RRRLNTRRRAPWPAGCMALSPCAAPASSPPPSARRRSGELASALREACGQHDLVLDLLRLAGAVEALLDAHAARAAVTRAELRIAQVAEHLPRERLDVRRRHERARRAVLQHLADAADVEGDDGLRERHGLDDRARQRIGVDARDDRDI